MTLTKILLLVVVLVLGQLIFNATYIIECRDILKDIKQCLDTIKRNEAHTMNCVEDIKNDLKDE